MQDLPPDQLRLRERGARSRGPARRKAGLVAVGLAAGLAQGILTSRVMAGAGSSPGWRLPPTNRVSRTYPRLVNYHHRWLAESQVDHREERLAQWNVVILNPDDVARQGLSLALMRATNPRLNILAWIPLGQEPGGMAIARGIPRQGKGDWFCRDAECRPIIAPWGGRFMNPYAGDFAWPKYAAALVATNYLRAGQYDGVLFDILSPGNWLRADLDGDGRCDSTDEAAWVRGQALAAERLRQLAPGAIIVGNGGPPWPAGCPYFAHANGCLHENALGDEFGVPGWNTLWDGHQTCLTRAKPQPAVFFAVVDVRHERTLEQAERLATLSDDDRRRMRLGLGTTLLGEGYFGFDRGDCLHGQLWWFDEYDADLGTAREAYRRDVFAAGTYSRQFERGVAIVNPTPAAVTVKLADALKDMTTRRVAAEFAIPAQDARLFVKP